MNTYITEAVEYIIPTLAPASIFFDDCSDRYYGLITGKVYTNYDAALNDAIDMLNHNLIRITG